MSSTDLQNEKEEKLKEFVDKSIEVIGAAAKKVGNTAKLSANAIGNSKIAQGAAAAGTEAARFAVDRTFEALERATDPNYGAFWEPRVDRFSMMPWYERQLVEETCELPLSASPLTEIIQVKSDDSGNVWSRTTPINDGEREVEDSSEWQVIAEDGLAEGELARRRGSNASPQPTRREKVETGNDSDSEIDQSDYDRATAYIGAPPLWTESPSCASCSRMFGITRYRHHCRSCGGSFCHAHSSRNISLPRLGFLTPVRCCDKCYEQLSSVELQQRTEWRLARIDAYERSKLIPYFEVAVDSHMHKARRLLEGTICLVKKVPLGASATITVEVMDILWKYGPPGIAGLVLRREFIEAAELLRKVSDLEESWPCSAPELMASLFYLLALKRGERGSYPDAEAEEHASSQAVSDAELRWVLSVAPFALHFCYMSSACEMQLRAAQRGFWLLFTKSESLPSQPAFCLFTRRGEKVAKRAYDEESVRREPHWWAKGACAVLAIRGTSDIYDVVTDIRTNPVPFPVSEPSSEDEELPADWTGGFDGMPSTVAVQGMATAAAWLLNETIESLRRLAASGHAIVLTGHSLGGGVASLLGVLLKKALPDAQIRVVTFGCPACMDETLANEVATFTTSVVLHDDIVPRLSPRSVRSLVADLLKNRERMTTLWRGDMDAVFGRAKALWVPRWRDSFLRQDRPFDRPAKGLLSPSHVDPSANRTRPLGMASDLHDGAQLRSKFILANSGSAKNDHTQEQVSLDNVEDVLRLGLEQRNNSVSAVDKFGQTRSQNNVNSNKTAQLKVQDKVLAWGIMKGSDTGDVPSDVDLSSSIIVDQGEFNAAWYPGTLISVSKGGCEVKFDDACVTAAVKGTSKIPVHLVSKVSEIDSEDALDEAFEESDDFDLQSFAPIIIDEVPLPELRVPGNVLHLWSQRGVFRVSHVSCASPFLTNFKLYGNMLTDHLAVNYFDALAEALDVLSAPCPPPEWVPFMVSNKCQCCRATFSWSATGTSGATTSREKHNCRGCGALVCGPCSENRRTVPRIGLNTKVRVCDNCFFDASALSQQPAKNSGLPASISEGVEVGESGGGLGEEERLQQLEDVGNVGSQHSPSEGRAEKGMTDPISNHIDKTVDSLQQKQHTGGRGNLSSEENEATDQREEDNDEKEEEEKQQQQQDDDNNDEGNSINNESDDNEDNEQSREDDDDDDNDDAVGEAETSFGEDRDYSLDTSFENGPGVNNYENLGNLDLSSMTVSGMVASGFSVDEIDEDLMQFDTSETIAGSPVGLRKRNKSK